MSSKVDYVFPRDYADNNRINFQHYLTVRLFGYHIHPLIPSDNPNLRIADVGCGSGVWLTDVADQLPKSVELDGIDVSFDALPPTPWIQENIALWKWDLKTEVPEELVGVYDIVHISHFCFVLFDDDLLPVLKNLNRLLKPGGYLQWMDIDFNSLKFEKTHPDNKIDAMKKIMSLSKKQDSRLNPTWVPNLAKLLTESGLIGVEEDARQCPPHLGMMMFENGMLVPEMFLRSGVYKGEVAEEFRRLLDEVAKESRVGAYWGFTRYTVVGKKAL